jgi:hypothetical protein
MPPEQHMSGSGPPVACEYETDAGGACTHRAVVKLTFEQDGARSMTGEPVRYFGHACHTHTSKAKRVPAGIRIVSVEAL